MNSPPEEVVVVTTVVLLLAGGGGGCDGLVEAADAEAEGDGGAFEEPNRPPRPKVRGGFGGTGST